MIASDAHPSLTGDAKDGLAHDVIAAVNIAEQGIGRFEPDAALVGPLAAAIFQEIRQARRSHRARTT